MEKSFVWRTSGSHEVNMYANIVSEDLSDNIKQWKLEDPLFTVERVCEFADHHLSEKGMPKPKMMFHANKHGYVIVKEAKEDACVCQVGDDSS
jgi:hypothetical protein